MVTKQFNLLAWQDNHVSVKAVQGEVLSRYLELHLIGSSTAVNLTNASVNFYGVKPDGNKEYIPADIVDMVNGIVSVGLTSQMSAVSGKISCFMQVVTSTKELRFYGITIEVIACDLTNAIISTNEFSALVTALGSVGSMNTHMTNKANPHEVTADQIGYTAADVLTKLKTVDGAGSGLDADTLDGLSSVSFATAAQGTKADSAFSKTYVMQLNHSTASQFINETQTVTLGFRPRIVRIHAIFHVDNGSYYDSDGLSDISTQLAVYKYGTVSLAPSIYANKIVYIHAGAASNAAFITYTSTGFTLAWTSENSSGLPVEEIKMLIEALG